MGVAEKENTAGGNLAGIQPKEAALLHLLQKSELASRPICFETIDVITGNRDAEKIVCELTGRPVDEAYRETKLLQLEAYLSSLEELALFWKLINEAKYQHRFKAYGAYNRDMAMLFPHKKPGAPFLSSQTLLSSCSKPSAMNNQGKKVEVTGKEYF